MSGRVPNKIPRYDSSSNQLSTQPGPTIDPERASAGGRNLQKVGDTIGTVGDALTTAFSLAEKTKAENFLEKSLATIEEQAANDPDFSAARQKKYHDEMAKAAKDASTMISLPSARGLFESEADRRREISRIKVDAGFTKRAIDDGKAQMLTFLDMQRQRYVTSNNPLDKQTAVLERDKKIDHMASTGYLAREAAVELKQKLEKEWDLAHLNYDIETNPAFVSEELAKGDQGFYRGIDAEARVNAQDKVTKRLEYLARKNREDTENRLMGLDAMRSLTPAQFEEAALTGSISRPFYKAMKSKYLSSLGPSAETDKKAYAGAVQLLLNPSIPAEQKRVRLLEDQAKGLISPEDFKKLYQMHLTPSPGGRMNLAEQIGAQQTQTDFEKLVKAEEDKAKNIQEKQGFLRAAMSMLTNAAGRDQNKAGEMAQKFTEKALDKKPEEYLAVARQVMSEEMRKARPEIVTYPKEGKVLMDAYGNKVRVFPDGTYQEEKS